jgi:protein-L-isoaspartate(D-aspartate) O-methyltransferase
MPDFAALRETMVARQIAGRGIGNRHLLAAMREVPRERFVDEALAAMAYEDGPLPIAAGQTVSQPYIVALMIEAAGIGPGDAVLEVGAGSGYAAAVMSRIAGRVTAIERHETLAAEAAARIARLGYDNVRIVQGDGSAGWPEGAPYDRIIVSASGSHAPRSLKHQLVVGGVLVIPIGAPGDVQMLAKVSRIATSEFEQIELLPVRFVPLIGAEGWPAERGD